MTGKTIPYQVIRSDRKTISIQIRNAEVIVRAPRRLSGEAIRAFVESKRGWIETHLAREEATPQLPPFTRQQLETLAQQALQTIPQRVAFYAPQVGVTYGRITIRNQRSRWGSCSGKGNLNFNCLLMLAPAEVTDYVIVHELCHRKEMNHSPKFWSEVARILPDYQSRRKWLKDHGNDLIRRLG